MKRTCLALACCLLCGSPGCRRARNSAAVVSEVVLASNAHQDRIVRGVYPGETAWRWTAPVFTFTLDPPTSVENGISLMGFRLSQRIAGEAAGRDRHGKGKRHRRGATDTPEGRPLSTGVSGAGGNPDAAPRRGRVLSRSLVHLSRHI